MRPTFFLIGILFITGGIFAPIVDKRGTAEMAVGIPPKFDPRPVEQKKRVTYAWATKEYYIFMKCAGVVGGGILIYLALKSSGNPAPKPIRRWIRKRKKARRWR